MDVPNVLDSLTILMILSCSISPSCKISRANDLIKVIHHLVGELGSEEGDSRPSVEQVCVTEQCVNTYYTVIHSRFPWAV